MRSKLGQRGANKIKIRPKGDNEIKIEPNEPVWETLIKAAKAQEKLDAELNHND